MFSQLRMREEQALLAQDYALEQAEEKGLERGRSEGLRKVLNRNLNVGNSLLFRYDSPRSSEF